MGNAQNVSEMSQDAYKHQKYFEEKKARNKILLGWIFLAMSVFSLVSVFVFPLYKYNYINNKAGLSLSGNFTAVKMISKYFSKGYGDYSVLNTFTMISSVLLIAVMIYIVVAAVVSVLFKGKAGGSLRRMTSFIALEIAATVQFILLMINMLFTKIDVSGNAVNGTEFWIIFVLSIVLVCFSISLSTPAHLED
ncbi:MAG: hypothetical protein HFI34_01595 [Lachnospiraceae bacterium]|nr:hypothetical protein [Lachnospiraceae bacterium]